MGVECPTPRDLEWQFETALARELEYTTKCSLIR